MAGKLKLVVVGNGMAGVRAIEELLKLDRDRFRITVFGAEPHGNYNRILLSPVLAGEKQLAEIVTHEPAWYAAQGITLHLGDAVTAIDLHARCVRSASGRVEPFDRLLLATGSQPFMPPVPGRDLPGVIAFRDIADVNRMLRAAAQHRHAVVIGGGVLGLEAAVGLKRRGMDVTVVHRSAVLMERQLDAHAGALLLRHLQALGVHFRLQANTAACTGTSRVQALRFDDGREIAADLVVMAAGIVPNRDLAESAGLRCERGVVVDDRLRTSHPHVYAVGECAQHRGVCYGLVAPLFAQARIVALNLLGDGAPVYEGSVPATKLKVTGIDVFSAGAFLGGESMRNIVFRDPRRGVYKRLVTQGDALVGAVLYGHTADSGWYFDLIQQRADVAALRSRLVFGRQFAEAA